MAQPRVSYDSPIWLPGSKGVTDLAVWRVDQAVREYDERLTVGRNEDNGQWCVYMKMPPGGDWPELYPVLGLTTPPHDPRQLSAIEVVNRLYNADTLRHGKQILHDLEAGQEAYRANERAASLELAGVAAEVFDFAHRRSGTHPEKRVLMSGRSRRGYGESW